MHSRISQQRFYNKVSNLIFYMMVCDTIIAPSLKSFFQEKSIFETIHSHRIESDILIAIVTHLKKGFV